MPRMIMGNGTSQWFRSIEMDYPGQDLHGGHAEEHREEMRAIAMEVMAEQMNAVIPQIRDSVYAEAYARLMEALTMDVKTAVHVALKNGADIFNDRKTQKIIAEAVTAEIRKQLKRLK